MTIVDDVDLFESVGETTFARSIHESKNPSFFYVLTDAGRVVSRIGVIAEESCPPNLRGSLPEREFRLVGCMLDGDGNDVPFLREVLASLPSEIAPYVDVISNPEFHRDADRLRSVYEQAGMALFQEKHSYHWDDPGISLEVPGRLTFADVTLERGATQDRDLFDWLQDVAITASGLGLPDNGYKRNLDIVQQDRDGRTLRRWSLSGAWPVKFVAGEWDNESDENVIEGVTLTFDYFGLST